jgi:hypothetical protein
MQFYVKKRDTMETRNNYQNAHLLVSAIRILEHQKSRPPSIEDVCQMVSFSLEQGNFMCNKLEDMGAIEVIEGAYGTRLFIKNHLILEEIPQDEQESRLGAALKEFQSSRKTYSKKVESIKADQNKKRKNLFADLEKKFKQDIEKRK